MNCSGPFRAIILPFGTLIPTRTIGEYPGLEVPYWLQHNHCAISPNSGEQLFTSRSVGPLRDRCEK